MSSANKSDSGNLLLGVLTVMLILVLLCLIPVFFNARNPLDRVIMVTMDFGLIASLLANLILYRRVKLLNSGARAPEPPQPKPKPAPQKRAAPPPGPPPMKFDPKLLPDPGLIYRFDLSKGDEKQKRIVIGQLDGTVKTYSTEIVDGHLEIDIRIKEDSDQDIYDQNVTIRQSYQVDFRRGGRAMVYYPGSDRFREMDARERIVVQEEPDASGDFQYQSLEPKNPIRFQLGDRLRHDGKFLKGYFEFHFFTKDVPTEVAGYQRIDKQFFLRLYKVFPGYDTAHANEEGLYPMIDPFLSR